MEVEVIQDSILLTDLGNVILVIVEALNIGPAKGLVELRKAPIRLFFLGMGTSFSA